MCESSGIIRVRKDRNYVSMHRGVFNDARLTWSARGLMGYLLTKSDNWEMRVYDLVNQGAAGKDAIYSMLRNLSECGYVRRVRRREKGGRFTWITEVYEVAQDLEEHGKDQPDAGNHEKPNKPPLPGFPEVVEPEVDRNWLDRKRLTQTYI